MTSTTPISENKDDRSADASLGLLALALLHAPSTCNIPDPRDKSKRIVGFRIDADTTSFSDPLFALAEIKRAALSKAPSGAGPTYGELLSERDALIKEREELISHIAVIHELERDRLKGLIDDHNAVHQRAETAEQERDEARAALKEITICDVLDARGLARAALSPRIKNGNEDE